MQVAQAVVQFQCKAVHAPLEAFCMVAMTDRMSTHLRKLAAKGSSTYTSASVVSS